MAYIAPIYMFIFILPTLMAEAELFAFFRHKIKKRVSVTDVITVIISVLILLFASASFIQMVFFDSIYFFTYTSPPYVLITPFI